MKHFRYLGNTDVSSIVEQIDLHHELWDLNRSRRLTSDVHAQMQDIWLRWKVGEQEPPFEFQYYKGWYILDSLHDLVFDLMRTVRATQLGGCLITRIPPKGRILPHNDKGSWHADNFNPKIYVILKTNLDTYFRCEDQKEVMSVGDVYIINNLVDHEVVNNGDTDRMSLIICTRTD